jgi:hypothetical protein
MIIIIITIIDIVIVVNIIIIDMKWRMLMSCKINVVVCYLMGMMIMSMMTMTMMTRRCTSSSKGRWMIELH